MNAAKVTTDDEAAAVAQIFAVQAGFVKRTICQGFGARPAIERVEKISRRAASAAQSASEIPSTTQWWVRHSARSTGAHETN
jgi:hypothetical protein